MDEEYFFIDKTAPIVDALEFKAGLNGDEVHAMHVFFKIGAII